MTSLIPLTIEATQYLVSGYPDGLIVIWDLVSRKAFQKLYNNPIVAVYSLTTLTYENKPYLVSGENPNISFWDLTTFKVAFTLQGAHQSKINTLLPFTMDSQQYLISGSGVCAKYCTDTLVVVWDLKSRKSAWSTDRQSYISHSFLILKKDNDTFLVTVDFSGFTCGNSLLKNI